MLQYSYQIILINPALGAAVALPPLLDSMQRSLELLHYCQGAENGRDRCILALGPKPSTWSLVRRSLDGFSK
jgi:hypothetical protein